MGVSVKSNWLLLLVAVCLFFLSGTVPTRAAVPGGACSSMGATDTSGSSLLICYNNVWTAASDIVSSSTSSQYATTTDICAPEGWLKLDPNNNLMKCINQKWTQIGCNGDFKLDTRNVAQGDNCSDADVSQAGVPVGQNDTLQQCSYPNEYYYYRGRDDWYGDWDWAKIWQPIPNAHYTGDIHGWVSINQYMYGGIYRHLGYNATNDPIISECTLSNPQDGEKFPQIAGNTCLAYLCAGYFSRSDLPVSVTLKHSCNICKAAGSAGDYCNKNYGSDMVLNLVCVFAN